jgi:hypothetical protein
MKNYSFLQVSLAIVILASSFGCSKNIETPDQYNHTEATGISSATIFYTDCGLSVNVFTPNPSLQYSFEYHKPSSRIYVPFGIDQYTEVTFSAPDKFTFEFAGHTTAGKFKTWRIKRTDGKYLTADNGILIYKPKLVKGPVNEQIFLIGSLGLSRYELINPGRCEIGTIAFDIDYSGYRFFIDPSGGTLHGDYQLGLISY